MKTVVLSLFRYTTYSTESNPKGLGMLLLLHATCLHAASITFASLHPYFYSCRYMFWSDLGVTAQIERALMDGSRRHVIIYSDLSRPVGLTLDYSEQRIYWSDVDLYRLEYCNYDGTSRYIVETVASGLLYPYALTVADDILFWTDWATDSVYATHKEHGSNDANGYFQTVASFSSNPYGIEALLDSRQEPGI